MKVLVLDDRREEQFKKRLESIGVQDMTFIKTSDECIEKLAQEVYDLIFLDYDLTFMSTDKPSKQNSGVEVVRWLREHQMNPNHKSQVVLHTPDPHGSEFMKDLFPQAIICPGAWMEDCFKDLVKKLKIVNK